ncbi:Abi family protein [Paractinoplanes globisporus]|uniref:Abi family protein n=1 Tax=Paractinoplanes globisporus TaxID=113565 RepID=A0ABW6WK03_9ACTN|nr:Abi family protein [Actinoplanes globisporus]
MTDRLSPERLTPYVIAGGDGAAAALDLYVWNAELAAALATTLGHVEVVLRNAIHQNLTAWSTRRFGEPRWYRDAGHLLHSRHADAIRVAQLRVSQHGRRTETPGRIVAELSFGFWRFLLTSHYDTTLWRQTLHQVFPGQRRRRVIHDAVEVLHLARNRIAHYEPMFNRPIADIQAIALEVTDWICPVTRAWIERQCRTAAVLRDRP